MSRRDWTNAPTVYVVKPACPDCGHVGYVSTKSDRNGDGSTTLKAVCLGCSIWFKIVTEPMTPYSGNLEDDVS